MKIDWNIWKGPEEAVQIQPALFRLFEKTFGRPFPEPLWRRLYVDNPYGPAISSAGYVGEQMVAHSGMIPQVLIRESGERLSYWLYISLMVDPEFRGKGAFRQLTQLGHDYAREAELDCILSFPNQLSFPPLQALCDWEVINETDLMDWTPLERDLPNWKPVPLDSWRLGKGWDVPDRPSYRSWRCSGGSYEALSLPDVRLIGKTYGRTYNLLDVESLGPKAASSFSQFLALRELSSVTLTDYHARKLGVPQEQLSSHNDYVLRFCMATPKKDVNFSDFRLNLLTTDTF